MRVRMRCECLSESESESQLDEVREAAKLREK